MRSKVREKKIVEEYKTKMDEYRETFFLDFCSQEGFEDYSIEEHYSLFPYVIKGRQGHVVIERHIDENGNYEFETSNYVVIRKK